MQQCVWDRLGVERRELGEPGVEAEHEHVVDFKPAGGRPAPGAWTPRRAAVGQRRAPRALARRSSATAAIERANSRAVRLRRAGGVRGGDLAEPRERPEALDDVGLGREQLLAAQPQALDQAVDVEVGAHRVDVTSPSAVELQEHPDPLAGLRRDLG